MCLQLYLFWHHSINRKFTKISCLFHQNSTNRNNPIFPKGCITLSNSPSGKNTTPAHTRCRRSWYPNTGPPWEGAPQRPDQAEKSPTVWILPFSFEHKGNSIAMQHEEASQSKSWEPKQRCHEMSMRCQESWFGTRSGDQQAVLCLDGRHNFPPAPSTVETLGSLTQYAGARHSSALWPWSPHTLAQNVEFQSKSLFKWH